MYHAHFRGTHYEAGFRWGSLLLKHKNIILENIPFEITQERIDYPKHHYPQDQAPRTLRQTSQGVSGNAPSDTVQ